MRELPLGLQSPGKLTLTTERMVWTPAPYFWGFYIWKTPRTEVKTLKLERKFLRLLWSLRVGSNDRNLLLIGGAERLKQWVRTIGEWANI